MLELSLSMLDKIKKKCFAKSFGEIQSESK